MNKLFYPQGSKGHPENSPLRKIYYRDEHGIQSDYVREKDYAAVVKAHGDVIVYPVKGKKAKKALKKSRKAEWRRIHGVDVVDNKESGK